MTRNEFSTRRAQHRTARRARSIAQRGIPTRAASKAKRLSARRDRKVESQERFEREWKWCVESVRYL